MSAVWQRAQTGQLSYQQMWAGSLDTEKFTRANEKMFLEWGFDPDGYRRKTILDLGCGSRLRSKFFNAARIVAIDPLADKYLNEVQGCDLNDAAVVITATGESHLPVFDGAADLVLCINVLDQCQEAAALIGNIAKYLKPGGLAFMTFDFRKIVSGTHPLTLDRESVEAWFTASGLWISKFEQQPAWTWEVTGRANYWLVKP